MSREDTQTTYEYGFVEIVELGVDHNGNKQWYASTQDGWEEIGKDGVLELSAEHSEAGTRIELHPTHAIQGMKEKEG